MPRRPFGFDAASHERHHWWRSLVFKLALGGGVVALLWWWVGGAAGVAMGVLIALRAFAQALAPDLVALTGDYVYRGHGDVRPIAHELARLRPRVGVHVDRMSEPRHQAVGGIPIQA